MDPNSAADAGNAINSDQKPPEEAKPEEAKEETPKLTYEKNVPLELSFRERMTEEELAVIDKFSVLKGQLKKVRGNKNFLGKFAATMERYFCFWQSGRFLCYYDEKPSLQTHPKNIIYLDEIHRIEQSPKKNKKVQFAVFLKNEKKIKLRGFNLQQTVIWMQALNSLKKVYSDKELVDFDIERKYKDKVDVRVVNMIMEEIEMSFFNQIKHNLDNDQFYKDKGLGILLDSLSEEMTKNRLWCGPMQISSQEVDPATQKSNRGIKKSSIGLFSGGQTWEPVYGLIVTSKSYRADMTDEELLEESKLPAWMKLDTLYLFYYNGPGDNSDYLKEYPAKIFMLVQPIDPEGLKMSYNFSVEMPGVIEYFGTRFAVETETWLKALRRAQKSQLELEFCKGEKLLRNTDSLIGMYRRKMGEQLKQRCHDEFQAIVEPLGDNLKKVDPADFLDVTQKAHDFLYATLDGLQAFRPFYLDLFKLYMKEYHVKFTEFVSTYWNLRGKRFGGRQIMRFLGILHSQENCIKEYGMTDPRYSNSYKDLSASFCIRTFNNLMPMVLEVLDKMQKEVDKERDTICVSHGPVDLFRLINEAVDCYSLCPEISICKALLGLIFKILSSFQTEFKSVVNNAEDMSVEVFSALTNSNVKFMAVTRQFIDKVSNATGLEPVEIQASMSYKKVIRSFAEISNLAFIRLQELTLFLVNNFFKKVKDYKGKFNIETFLEEIITQIGPISQMLNRVYAKKLWKIVFESFTHSYIQLIIIHSTKYKSKEKEALVKKVTAEVEIFEEFFDDWVPAKEHGAGMATVNDLVVSLTGRIDDIIDNMVNLKVKLGDKLNDKCIKCLIRLRPEITKEQKMKWFKLMKAEEDKINYLRKTNSSKMFYKGVMTQFHVHRFVNKLKARMAEKALNQSRVIKKKVNKELMSINDNERLEMEENAQGLKGVLEFTSKKFDRGKHPMMFVRAAPGYKFTSSHFSFLKDLFVWKDKAGSSDVLGRISLISMRNIDLGNQEIFYFIANGTIYLFRCPDGIEQMKKWIKALIFLKEQAEAETKPIKFEEFCVVEKNKIYDKLFKVDLIDYTYEQIKLKQRQRKKIQAFDVDQIDIDENMVERSVEELSNDSDSEDTSEGEDPIPTKAKALKEQERKRAEQKQQLKERELRARAKTTTQKSKAKKDKNSKKNRNKVPQDNQKAKRTKSLKHKKSESLSSKVASDEDEELVSEDLCPDEDGIIPVVGNGTDKNDNSGEVRYVVKKVEKQKTFLRKARAWLGFT